MKSREQLLRNPIYWFDKAQNELFRQFHYFMEREGMNRTQLGHKLGISKGRVSQILNGDSNFTMKSIIELGLKIGVIPEVRYSSLEDHLKADKTKWSKPVTVVVESTPITNIASGKNTTNLPLKFYTTTNGEGMLGSSVDVINGDHNYA